jgi:hypothetical protein
MPKENQTLYVPFRLRNPGGAFQVDTNVLNYSIAIRKDGSTFVPASGPTIVSLGSLGRHELTFQAGAEGQYTVAIDHNDANREVSIESSVIFIDEFLTSDLSAQIAAAGDPADVADAVWDEVLAGHLGAGAAGAFVTRILQLSQPDVVINPTTNVMELRDKDTNALLLTYDITGIIDSRITDADAT